MTSRDQNALVRPVRRPITPPFADQRRAGTRPGPSLLYLGLTARAARPTVETLEKCRSRNRIVDEQHDVLLVGDCLGVTDGVLTPASVIVTSNPLRAEELLHRLLAHRGMTILFSHVVRITDRARV